tara:strand:- start:920 stop:1204 length:285 start_codon:yes stop_codon:yes gene_type:complete
MARKQELSDNVKEIKNALKDNKAIIGADRTLKVLKNGKLAKVFISNNCESELKQELEKYCTMANVPLVQIKYSNEELGVFCKKQFFISVFGVGA